MDRGAAAALASRPGGAHGDASRRHADHPELVHQELHHRSRRRARRWRAGSARAVVVNIGGDIVARGAWTETVGVTDPLDNADNAAPLTRLAVRDRAVATSGSYRRGFDIGGRHYSHIVDPRTGRPTSQVRERDRRRGSRGRRRRPGDGVLRADARRQRAARGERAGRRVPDRAGRRQPDPERRAGGRSPPRPSRASACRAP